MVATHRAACLLLAAYAAATPDTASSLGHCDGTNASCVPPAAPDTRGQSMLQKRSVIERVTFDTEDSNTEDSDTEGWAHRRRAPIEDVTGTPPCINERGGIPHNQRKNLEPLTGAWRGSCVGWSHEEGFIAEYEKKYGVQMHLYRFFSKNPVTKEMRLFVKGGGILWYNIAMSKWRDTHEGKLDHKIDDHAKMVASFAPAKVFVVLAHEPDHEVDAEKARTAEDFRKMWAYVHNRFKEQGVTNAVWAMDFSVGLTRAIPDPVTGLTHQWENALDLWPGTKYVDWLFFNLFQRGMDPKIGNDFLGELHRTYEQLEAAEDGDCIASCGFKDMPWGVGAFGTHTLPEGDAKEGTRNGIVPPADQRVWFDQARASMADHPRVKAYIYFDSLLSMISDEVSPTYKEYLKAPYFTENDPGGDASAGNDREVDARDAEDSGRGSDGDYDYYYDDKRRAM